MIAAKAMKPGKALELFELGAEMISASGLVEISVLMELLPTCIRWTSNAE